MRSVPCCCLSPVFIVVYLFGDQCSILALVWMLISNSKDEPIDLISNNDLLILKVLMMEIQIQVSLLKTERKLITIDH